MSNWLDKDGRRHVGVMVAGKRVHRILAKGSTASDAKRLESEIRSALGRRETQIPGNTFLTGVMELYLEHAATLRSTETALVHARRIQPWLVGYRADEARTVAANIIRDMRPKYAAATINRSVGALSKALKLAWERGKVPIDYSGHVKRIPEANQRDVTLTLDEVEKLARAATQEVGAAIWIATYTGLRRGEICTIQPADIGKDTITIRAGNTKTLKTRVVPIIAPLRPWLRYLPLSLTVEGLKSGFERARKKAGMEHVNFHDLRRTCATLMIESGQDIYAVSKLLGHSSIAVTQARYAYLQVDKVREALEATFAKRKRAPRAARKSV